MIVRAGTGILVCIFLTVLTCNNRISAEEETNSNQPSNGFLDYGSKLEKGNSLLLVPVPITEPAVGYGLALGAVYLQSRPGDDGETTTRPNISGVVAMKTENKSQGVGVYDSRYWGNGSFNSQFVGVSGSVNFDVYAPRDGTNKISAYQYNLESDGGLIVGKWNLPLNNASVAVNYGYFDIIASAVGIEPPPLLPDRLNNVFSSMGIAFAYDTRDNQFSPNKGIFSKTSYAMNDKAIGASESFQKLSQVLIGYWPLNEKWTAGLKLDGQAIYGDFPFYAKPYIHLRGVPAMHLQGKYVAFGELEFQYRVSERIRLVGFAGAGQSWDDFGPIEINDSTTSGGLGIRYRVAQDFGVDMGLDFAVSEGEEAIYFQLGTAWLSL